MSLLLVFLIMMLADMLVQDIQILDKAVCILYNAHTLGNDMNPTLLSPAMGK